MRVGEAEGGAVAANEDELPLTICAVIRLHAVVTAPLNLILLVMIGFRPGSNRDPQSPFFLVTKVDRSTADPREPSAGTLKLRHVEPYTTRACRERHGTCWVAKVNGVNGQLNRYFQVLHFERAVDPAGDDVRQPGL